MDRARAKPPKAVRTTDVARPRMLALSALGAVAGVTLGVAAEGTPLATERPIARPHRDLKCVSCHAESSAAEPTHHMAEGCKTCHGTSHVSMRPAHRALAAKGELPCASCHAQHAGSQGLTFDRDTILRWGAGVEVPLSPPRQSGVAPGAVAKGTTVPLVSLAACARCHDPSRASDPISACVPSRARAVDLADAGPSTLGTIPALCFDEHAGLGEVRGGAGRVACASQHGATRFVAWDAAREIAATTAWVTPVRREGTPWIPPASALVGALVLGGAAVIADRRKRSATFTPAVTPAASPTRKRLPVIDPSTCLGCYACVDACPFDVLTIDKYVAVVARPEECCGVVLCEQVCPNGSLRVADGEPIVDRPLTDEHLESAEVPGLFLAGDLTGLPLIKNAINQGTRVIDRIAATLPRRRAESTDVVVIGAGPAGLSAALRAKEKGLSCVVLEQATVASSIRGFPRDKIVHDPPLDLPIEGELWLKEATKDELLAQWTRIVRARAIEVREGHRVVDVEARDAGFVIVAEHDGERVSLRASRVVLAIGRRGTPRTLDLTIEEGAENRVAHALADARSFEGKRVLVVGLGDAAMEAAIALARQPGTSVTMSYRGARFARGKAKNIAAVERLVAERKLRILFETVPVEVTKTGVTLRGTGPHGGRRSLAIDAVLVLIGGVPAWDFLARVGVRRSGAVEGSV